MPACRVLGHRYGFTADGPTMRWDCERCGSPGGTKTYGTAAEAAHFAAAFDERDSDQMGRRAPMLGMAPLRMWHRLRHGR